MAGPTSGWIEIPVSMRETILQMGMAQRAMKQFADAAEKDMAAIMAMDHKLASATDSAAKKIKEQIEARRKSSEDYKKSLAETIDLQHRLIAKVDETTAAHNREAAASRFPAFNPMAAGNNRLGIIPQAEMQADMGRMVSGSASLSDNERALAMKRQLAEVEGYYEGAIKGRGIALIAANDAEKSAAEYMQIASTAKTGAIATEAEWHVQLIKTSQQIEANQKKMRELATSTVGDTKTRETAMNALAQQNIVLSKEQQELNRKIEHGTGGLKNNRVAMQQLAFGVQDFVSAGGLHNLAQGFRGAANNAEMMAMSLGSTMSPLKLLGITLIPTAALAAVDLAMHFGKSGEKADDAAKNGLANYKSALQGIIDKTNEVTQTEFQRDQGKSRAQYAEGRKAAVDERQAALDDWKGLKNREEQAMAAARQPGGAAAGAALMPSKETMVEAKRRLDLAERNLGEIESAEAKRREASVAKQGVGKHKSDLFKAASEVARGMKAAGATQAEIDKKVRGVFRGAMGANVRGDVADEVTGAMMDEWHDDERGHAIDRDIERMKPGAAQGKRVEDLRRAHQDAKNATRRGKLRPREERQWKLDIDAAEAERDRVGRAVKDEPNAVLPSLQAILERVARGVEEQTRIMKEKVDPGQAAPARLPNLGFGPMDALRGMGWNV